MKIPMFDGGGRRLPPFEEAYHAFGDRSHATAGEEVQGVLRVHQHDDSLVACGMSTTFAWKLKVSP